MGSEILVVSLAALILGATIAYLLREKIREKFSRSEKEKNRIINDPDLLLEKLNQNGEIVDVGEKLEYSVIEKDGERQLSLKKMPHKDSKTQGRKDK